MPYELKGAASAGCSPSQQADAKIRDGGWEAYLAGPSKPQRVAVHFLRTPSDGHFLASSWQMYSCFLPGFLRSFEQRRAHKMPVASPADL